MLDEYNQRGVTILSIVMITVPQRLKEFKALRNKVELQIAYCKEIHPNLGDVEICTVLTKKVVDGGPSIGEKRTRGIVRSQGKYICWLDDDDDIAPNYVETLLRLAMADADVLTFNSLTVFNDYWALVQMNLDFTEDEQMFPGIVHRRPYHVCGWKLEKVKDLIFPSVNVDEDTSFVKDALLYCKTQSKTEAILHKYDRTTKSLAVETWQEVK